MKKQLWNDSWSFRRVSEEESKIVNLPHDAMIYEKRTPNALTKDAGAFFEISEYVYEKELTVNARHACLEFDGVYKNARVYLNGELKKESPYGYAPFVVELGEVREGDVVRVECGIAAAPDSRWYPGAGIYRDVNLYTTDEDEYVRVNGVKVSTVDYKKGIVNVKVDAEKALVEIVDNGQVIAKAEGNDVELTIDKVQLWSAETPYLYTVRVTVGNDTVEDRFGVRKVEYNRTGLYVNGINTLLRGGCLHHDNGLLGSATYYKSEYRRVKKLKEAGFNAIRSSHNPTSRHLLQACDELGMYVMDETWDMWFHKKSKEDYGGKLWREHHNEDIANMVNRDFNHPSVILYSIGNEVSEPAKPEGLQAIKDMVALIHSLDPNRLVTGGFNLMIIANAAKGKGIYDEEGGMNANNSAAKTSGMNSTMFNMITSMVGTGMNKSANSKQADAVVSPAMDALDLAGYNYASGRYKLDAKLHPERVIFGSETFPHTIDENWNYVRELDTVVGDFIWTAWDYIGENGIGAWAYGKENAGFFKNYPWWLADVGAFDILGNPNAEAYWVGAAWDKLDKPAMTIQPVKDEKPYKGSWRGTNGLPSYSWKDCEGKKAVCEVFFHCAKVELYQNGKKIASRKPKGSRTIFKIKYIPGTLEAVAYDASGKEIGRNKLVSANRNVRTALLPEEKSVKLNDIVYVDVCICDDKGVVESNADTKVKVSVENGELLAFGSARPNTVEDLHSGEYNTYYGRALAIVKATGKGTIKVKAESRYNSAETEIEVR